MKLSVEFISPIVLVPMAVYGAIQSYVHIFEAYQRHNILMKGISSLAIKTSTRHKMDMQSRSFPKNKTTSHCHEQQQQ